MQLAAIVPPFPVTSSDSGDAFMSSLASFTQAAIREWRRTHEPLEYRRVQNSR